MQWDEMQWDGLQWCGIHQDENSGRSSRLGCSGMRSVRRDAVGWDQGDGIQ